MDAAMTYPKSFNLAVDTLPKPDSIQFLTIPDGKALQNFCDVVAARALPHGAHKASREDRIS